MSASDPRCAILSRHNNPDRHHPPARVGLVCHGHAREIERKIDSVTLMLDDLIVAHTSKGGEQEKVSGTTSPGVPLRDAVVDAQRALMSVLRKWAYGVAQTRGLMLVADDAECMTRLLRRQLPWLLAQPEVAAFHDELKAALDVAQRVAFPSGWRHLEIKMPDGSLARCLDADRCTLADHTEIRCIGVLTAVVSPAADLLPSYIECNGCGRKVSAADWLSYGRRLHRVAA